MRFQFSTTIGSDSEISVTVEADYSPEVAGRMYLRNGDPGYPTEPAELDIISVIGPDGAIDFESLPQGEQDAITDEGYERGRDLAYEAKCGL